jgi:hypothetical protein
LIENASDRVPLRCESVLPEAFPIKPSDYPGPAQRQWAQDKLRWSSSSI